MKSKQSGSVFLISLVAIAVLTLALATAVATQRVEVRVVLNRVDGDRARFMAESAIEYAMHTLADTDVNLVTLNDPWALLGEDGAREFLVHDGSFRVQIIDASSFVNLNTATEEHLNLLPLTSEQIASLLDWRGPELQPRTEGAKDEFYNSLTVPYNTALRGLLTVDELLLVRGFSPQTLFEVPTDIVRPDLQVGLAEDQPTLVELVTVDSASPNTDETGQMKINVNQASVGDLVQAGLTQELAEEIILRRNTQGTFTSLAQLFLLQGVTLQTAQVILDRLTVVSAEVLPGRINVNTVGEPVLRTIPDISDQTVAEILRLQGNIANIGDIANYPGVNIDFMRIVGASLTTGSSTFVIRAIGRTNTSTYALEAVVRIVANRPVLVRMGTVPLEDPVLRWGWPEETTTQTVISEGPET